MGTYALSQDENKPVIEYDDDTEGYVDSKKDNTNQHLSEENKCYRSNSCDQVNGDSQIIGQGNTVTGFTDQSKNVKQPPGATKPQQTGLAPVIPSDKAIPQVRFPQGVASGEVSSNSAILWTRVDHKTPVQVEVSTSPDFKKISFKDTVIPQSTNDFTAKIVATDLQPDQMYYYHWRHGSAISETGTFKTAPFLDTIPEKHVSVDSDSVTSNTSVKFAWTADSDVSKVNGTPVFGDWKALDAVRSEVPDFFIYLGDTIYSDLRAGGKIPDAQTLDEYRQIYKDSRDVEALHNLLLATSIYPLWDDHEVRADWAGQTVDPKFFKIGNQSFYEYMPLLQQPQQQSNSDTDAAIDNQQCAGPPQFRVNHWGKDVDLIFIDTRSCRSASVEDICHNDLAPTLPAFIRSQNPSFFPPNLPAGCLDAINNQSRTMLGSLQKSMFEEALLNSEAKYKFVITSVPIQQIYALPYDNWEGYAAERKEILNFIRDNNIQNVTFLTATLHLNLMNQIFIDRFTDPAPIAYEFITGPIAQTTEQQRILQSFGPNALNAFQGILNLVGADCRELDAYSYGSVQVDSKTGTATITLKDQDGNIIHDQLNPAITCTKTFEAGL
jgi:phosphodiesterase/alkaline phosphatase D-like protein